MLTFSFKVFFYCLLVGPTLEYGTIIWDPYTAENDGQVERVQRRFLRFTDCFLDINFVSHDYTPVSNQLCFNFIS